MPESRSETRKTHDHDEIRRWAEERGAVPSRVRGTGDPSGEGDVGLIRLDFPGFSEAGVEPISWEDWFRSFDDNQLAFVYQETTSDGEASNFNQLVSREAGNGHDRTRWALEHPGPAISETTSRSAKAGKRRSPSARATPSGRSAAGGRGTAKRASPARRAASGASAARGASATGSRKSSSRVSASKRRASSTPVARKKSTTGRAGAARSLRGGARRSLRPR